MKLLLDTHILLALIGPGASSRRGDSFAFGLVCAAALDACELCQLRQRAAADLAVRGARDLADEHDLARTFV